MSMRLRATLLIILIVFISTAANFSSGWYLINNSMRKSLEQDLTFAIGIANSLAGTKMNLMKSEATTMAGQLASADSGMKLRELMSIRIKDFPDILALSVFDRNGIIASYSVPQHDHDLHLHDEYMERVYGGATIISSPFYCSVRDELVMNVYTPMQPGRILAVAMPGMIFSDMFSKHRLWQTGNIFMLNEVGMFIGAADEKIVSEMDEYIAGNRKRSNLDDEEIVGLIQKILSVGDGVERYHFGDSEYLCAYSRIGDSALGWRVAVTVPLNESPQADAIRGLIYAAAAFLAIGVVAAFFLSRVTAQPFKRIEIQNRDLEKLNESVQHAAAELEIALADAKEANSAKSNFLARMSHEIRTPLNAVIGLSELTIDEETLSQGAESNLEKIYGAGSTILSIVNDILDISKIESGKFEIYPVRYDTPSLINDTVTLNITRIREKCIAFKLYVDENLPATLLGDDLRIKQIFNNLLSNAFKYTNSGTVEWRVSFERDGGSVWLVSSVRDTGIGIKPEDMQKLFSDYNQVDIQTNRKVEGTGLGLAIAKRLADMMDGAITVESERDKGSTFHVRLRQTFVTDIPIGEEVAQSLMDLRYTLSRRARGGQPARANLSYAHVLVVDDIATNLDVVKGMLKPYGIHVHCATCGRQAIEMIQAENPRYNAVFMDHMMPGMDGIEAVRIIRGEIGTEYAANVPIIALTANAIVGNEDVFLRQGFQAFISKPIDTARLDAALRRWVRDKSLEKEDVNAGEDASLPVNGHPGAGNGNADSLFAGIMIGGVDMHKALKRFGGDETVFADILRSYAANTPPLLTSLRECLAAKNFKDYAIVVHGIKGSSYGIFAQEVGRAAESLEAAAKTGNFATVQAGHDAFDARMEALLNNIRKALATIEAAADANRPTAAKPDPELLEELREACKTFAMDRVDKAMAELESFRYESGGELVARLREKIDAMAFEEIADGEGFF